MKNHYSNLSYEVGVLMTIAAHRSDESIRDCAEAIFNLIPTHELNFSRLFEGINGEGGKIQTVLDYFRLDLAEAIRCFSQTASTDAVIQLLFDCDNVQLESLLGVGTFDVTYVFLDKEERRQQLISVVEQMPTETLSQHLVQMLNAK